jgi:hypothetical protein
VIVTLPRWRRGIQLEPGRPQSEVIRLAARPDPVDAVCNALEHTFPVQEGQGGPAHARLGGLAGGHKAPLALRHSGEPLHCRRHTWKYSVRCRLCSIAFRLPHQLLRGSPGSGTCDDIGEDTDAPTDPRHVVAVSAVATGSAWVSRPLMPRMLGAMRRAHLLFGVLGLGAGAVCAAGGGAHLRPRTARARLFGGTPDSVRLGCSDAPPHPARSLPGTRRRSCAPPTATGLIG